MTYLTRLFVFIWALIGGQPVEPATCPVNYGGMNLCFQTTVGVAVNQYKLRYTAPGHYYTVLPDGTTCVLHYKSFLGDFIDEYQPQTVLYDRIVNAYVFKIPYSEGRFEKEMHKLESLTGSKLTVSKQTIKIVEMMSKEEIADMPTQGTFSLVEGSTKDSVRIFLREVPRLSDRQLKEIEVIFTSSVL